MGLFEKKKKSYSDRGDYNTAQANVHMAVQPEAGVDFDMFS